MKRPPELSLLAMMSIGARVASVQDIPHRVDTGEERDDDNRVGLFIPSGAIGRIKDFCVYLGPPNEDGPRIRYYIRWEIFGKCESRDIFIAPPYFGCWRTYEHEFEVIE